MWFPAVKTALYFCVSPMAKTKARDKPSKPLLNMTATSTETTTAMTPASSSLLDQADGSAEDLMAQMRAAGPTGTGKASRKPGPNATFDSGNGSAFRPASAATFHKEEQASALGDITTKSTSTTKAEKESPPSSSPVQKQVATANIKYKNQSGRAAILAASIAVHHDFGALTSILNVTLPLDVVADLSSNPNVEWVDSNGAVYFVQPYRY